MPNARIIVLLALCATPLGGCNIPPAHSELYPPDEAGLSDRYIITHDPHYPWQFQRYDNWDNGGR